jgi:hypothetical protein
LTSPSGSVVIVKSMTKIRRRVNVSPTGTTRVGVA